MAELKQAAANAAMVGGIEYPRGRGVNYDEGLQRQFFGTETREYAARYGHLASNVYKAMCQGLNRENFTAYSPVLLRAAGAAKSATGETMPDDWQRVHLLKPKSVSELPPGAYLQFANNTWIVYKGTNIASVLGDGIIRRCNSVINTLDWYGNIVSVPMSFSKMGTLGNASHATENSIVAKNYISCVCQKNEVSAAFRENTRFIMGDVAYSMRGLNDFTREFTDDNDTTHLMTFTVELSEPLPQDSIEKQCADYFSFRWRFEISGEKTLKTGGSTRLAVQSVRMGEPVETSEEHPISYVFATSDESVATVDAEGLVTAAGAGEATITVSLAQNPEITATWPVSVEEAPGRYAAFTSTVFPVLPEYESQRISAALFVDGAESGEALTWAFTGPPESAYEAQQTGPNTFVITCYTACVVPLTVTATAESGESVSREIRLTAG